MPYVIKYKKLELYVHYSTREKTYYLKDNLKNALIFDENESMEVIRKMKLEGETILVDIKTINKDF